MNYIISILTWVQSLCEVDVDSPICRRSCGTLLRIICVKIRLCLKYLKKRKWIFGNWNIYEGGESNALSHSQMRISSHKFPSWAAPSLCWSACCYLMRFHANRVASTAFLASLHLLGQADAKHSLTFWVFRGKIKPERWVMPWWKTSPSLLDIRWICVSLRPRPGCL